MRTFPRFAAALALAACTFDSTGNTGAATLGEATTSGGPTPASTVGSTTAPPPPSTTAMPATSSPTETPTPDPTSDPTGPASGTSTGTPDPTTRGETSTTSETGSSTGRTINPYEACPDAICDGTYECYEIGNGEGGRLGTWCTPVDCDVAGCPESPGNATAECVPIAGGGGFCLLDCAADPTGCPEGMECASAGSARRCLWPDP